MPREMPAIITRQDFGSVLTPVHKKIFFDSYNEKPKQYSQIFKTQNMRQAKETFQHLGALGAWKTGQEGKAFNLTDFQEGKAATFTAERYDNSYKITWELCKDDLYNVFQGIGKGGSAQALGRGARLAEEKAAANVVLKGFADKTPTVGYDGKALFATDHPLVDSDQTCSNLITGALSDAKLKEALTLMRLQVDEANELIDAHANQLVVSPNQEFTAKAIVNSILQSGTNNNDINTVPNLEVVVWDYLQDTNIWFIQDTSIDNLLFLVREAPIFDSQFIPGQIDSLMWGYTRFATGYCDWRGLVGSYGEAE